MGDNDKFSGVVRWALIIPAVLLGSFLYGQARMSWISYWLMTDGRQGVAIVTNELWSGHDVVDYKYTVDQREYRGRSQRNWEDPKYSHVGIGQESVVYFSPSHPWLSLLYKPRTLIVGLPVLVVALLMESLFIITIINPRSNYAMNLTGKGKRA